jgi:hypothetical protein
LKHEEFARRFSLHILPRRFVRIRHYGILSSRWKRGKLEQLQDALKITRPEKAAKMQHLKCRSCHEGNLVTILIFGKRGPPKYYLLDHKLVPVN